MTQCLKYCLYIICLLQVLATGQLWAQEPALKHLTVRDGLPNGTIYSMLNDSKGYVWFATEAGVSQFDGHKFTNFTLSEGLAENEILKLAEDSKGRIWLLGLSGSLSYYYNGKFYNPSNDSTLAKARISSTYISFFEDHLHRLWFSSYLGYTMIDGKQVMNNNSDNGHIYSEGIVLDHKGDKTGILPAGINHPKFKNNILYIYTKEKWEEYPVKFNKKLRSRFSYLKDGSALFVSDQGIVLQKDTIQKLILPTAKILPNTLIFGVTQSTDSLLWIETANKGLYCFQLKDLSAPPELYLENTSIADVIEDREHNIWIATFGDGVYMLSALHKTTINFYSLSNTNHNVYCLAIDNEGNIFSGHDRETIKLIKKGTYKPMEFIEADGKGVGNKKARNLLIQNDDIWFGADNGIWHINRISKHINRVVELLEINNKQGKQKTCRTLVNIKDVYLYNNELYLCTPAGVYRSINKTDSIDFVKHISKSSCRKFCICVDTKGTVWCGASDGLYSINDTIETNHAAENKYLESSIYDIAETEDSVLVLASYGNGLLFYKDGKILHHLKQDDGLTSNLCRRLYIHNNDIFVATPSGGTKVTYNNYRINEINRYTIEDGLISNNVNDIYANDSEIWFATTEGLTLIKPMNQYWLHRTPLFYITGINCNNTPLKIDSNYTFPYTQNSLQFRFIGISYQFPDKLIYEYRMADNGIWKETKNTILDFPLLANGKYSFQVRCRLPDGRISEIKYFNFTIDPPFWKSIGFISLGFISFILAFFL